MYVSRDVALSMTSFLVWTYEVVVFMGKRLVYTMGFVKDTRA
jgi:hypothetical protein